MLQREIEAKFWAWHVCAVECDIRRCKYGNSLGSLERREKVRGLEGASQASEVSPAGGRADRSRKREDIVHHMDDELKHTLERGAGKWEMSYVLIGSSALDVNVIVSGQNVDIVVVTIVTLSDNDLPPAALEVDKRRVGQVGAQDGVIRLLSEIRSVVMAWATGISVSQPRLKCV